MVTGRIVTDSDESITNINDQDLPKSGAKKKLERKALSPQRRRSHSVAEAEKQKVGEYKLPLGPFGPFVLFGLFGLFGVWFA